MSPRGFSSHHPQWAAPGNLSKLASPEQPAGAPLHFSLPFSRPLCTLSWPACLSQAVDLSGLCRECCLASCLRSSLLGEPWKRRGWVGCLSWSSDSAGMISGRHSGWAVQRGASVCPPVIPIPTHALQADSSWEVRCCHLVCGLLGPLSQILKASPWHPQPCQGQAQPR